MPLRYLHYFGNEASESLLEAYRVVTTDYEQINALQYKQCPNCAEPNKPDARFCVKCNIILTYDAYNETIEREKSEAQNLRDDMKSMRDQMNQIMVMIQRNPRLANIKPEVLVGKSQ
jgi:hypothetical protein